MAENTTHVSEKQDPNSALSAVEQYVAFWNAATADDRRRLAAATFSDRVTYHAPVGVLRGADELSGFRNQFAQHSPGYVFRPRAESQAHHGRARLQWELVVDGKSFATGTDVLELDDHGRIAAISSFLDRAPEGFAHADH
jgi:hypothetical protein